MIVDSVDYHCDTFIVYRVKIPKSEGEEERREQAGAELGQAQVELCWANI